MRSFLLTVLGLVATSSLAAPKVAAQEGISAFEAVRKLKLVPQGYVHIADDGVARSYDENESVIDYVPLTNDQLKQLLSNLPEAWQKEADHLHAVFDNVDGRQVIDEKTVA
ncbi:lactobacillus up-regulated protein [Aspergillus udagawae]|uniref:Lactobacillus up-regulated protein n=1 Tax=Aspergillus udagawae TaxID=91492 RepID=A0ABQ1AJA1_9EURO|nr:lactobacillus up-regulated protein [Aspergillus udagawae]GFF82925.1 lactobacillus up-regulated protein [Aspergillus udagawae]GFG17071.1 lactobacillus up-regulated protein [Aspergillus udagawae]GFG20367.1 lactobacillus up-regulated protein [Aspergillus udagawae]